MLVRSPSAQCSSKGSHQLENGGFLRCKTVNHPVIYSSQLNLRFLTTSALRRNFSLLSRLALGNGRSFQTKNFEQPPCQKISDLAATSILKNKIFLSVLVCVVCFGQTFCYAKPKAHCSERFLIVTVPKSGTHLLIKCMNKIVGMSVGAKAACKDTNLDEWMNQLIIDWNRGVFLSQHMHHSQELAALLRRHQFKMIFLVRDPRDQTISALNWFLEGHWAGVGQRFIDANELTYEDKIHALITGEYLGISVFETFFRPSLPWLNYPKDWVYVVKFEDLVGPKGGGTLKAQIQAVIGIANHIGIKLSISQARGIAEQLYGETYTFRNGQIGRWKECFTKEHYELFEQKFGQELIDLGYE